MGQNDSNDHVENGIKGSFKAALERAKQKAREAAQRKNSLPQMNPDTSVCADSATSDMQISTRLDTITAPAHQSLETEIPIRVAGTSTRRENTNNEASATNIYSSLTSAKKRKLGKVIDSEQTQFEIGPPDTLPPCARQPSLPKMDNRRPFAPPKKPKRKSASYDEMYGPPVSKFFLITCRVQANLNA